MLCFSNPRHCGFAETMQQLHRLYEELECRVLVVLQNCHFQAQADQLRRKHEAAPLLQRGVLLFDQNYVFQAARLLSMGANEPRESFCFFFEGQELRSFDWTPARIGEHMLQKLRQRELEA